MSLDTLKNGLMVTIQENPLGIALGATGVGVAAGLGTAAIIGAVKNKKSSSRSSRKRGGRIKHTKRGLKQDRRRISKQSWEQAYQRRKRRMGKSKRRGKVYYARKTGQPYIILSSGKAKFIKGKRRKR